MGPVLSRNETKQCMHNVSRQFRPSSAQPWWWRRCWSLICKIHLRYARESRAYPGDLRADQFGRNLITTMQSRFQTVSWAHKDDQPEDEMTLMDKYWIADSCWQKYVICDFTFNFVSRKKWSMLADVFFLPFAYKQTHLLSFQLSLLSTGQISQRTVCMIPGSMAAPTHRDIKHCFLVLSRDFFQYGSCAGSFYQEQKMANIGEFKIVSSEIPWKKMLKLALSLFFGWFGGWKSNHQMTKKIFFH